VRPLAVLGATGFTGRLVCAAARELGLVLCLVGRRPEALRAFAAGDEEVRVADARDAAALRAAFDGAFAIASCAGPFSEVGTAPLEAALAAGAHYVDTSGEQAFARLVYERFDAKARERGLALLTSFGFDYAVGDVAARLAAEGLEPLDQVVVGYAVERGPTSRGTRRTIAWIAGQTPVHLVDGRLAETRLGSTRRRFRFPFGELELVEFGGGEALTVPRHTEVREVRSYLRLSPVAARLVRLAPAVAPVLRVVAGRGGDPPPAATRGKRFAVVAEAGGPVGARRVVISGRDPYGVTARLVAYAALALRDGDVRSSGALAPSEVFDPRTLLARLQPLVEPPAVESDVRA
jgi:short subunit dehydrogenase-like uncharacterized protein